MIRYNIKVKIPHNWSFTLLVGIAYLIFKSEVYGFIE